jgi:hypothetical protein
MSGLVGQRAGFLCEDLVILWCGGQYLEGVLFGEFVSPMCSVVVGDVEVVASSACNRSGVASLC